MPSPVIEAAVTRPVVILHGIGAGSPHRRTSRNWGAHRVVEQAPETPERPERTSMSKRRWLSLALASLLATPVLVFGVADSASAAVCLEVVLHGHVITVCTP
jgi:hypothetical protein